MIPKNLIQKVIDMSKKNNSALIDIVSRNYNNIVGFDLTNVAPVSSAPSFWETEVKTIDATNTDESADVTIFPVARTKISYLMQKFPRIEWLAYLIGNKETNEIFDIVIPEQEITVVHVDVLDGVDVPIIGVIHSHHDMGNTFSHTDDEFINGNHDISLCISHTGISGQVRWEMDNGDYMAVTANIIEPVDGFDEQAFEQEIKDNISRKTYSTNYQQYYQNLGGVSGSSEEGTWDIDIDDDLEPTDMVLGHLAENLFLAVKDEETNKGHISEQLKDELYLIHTLMCAAHSPEYSSLEDELYYNNVGGYDDLTQELFDVMEEVSAQNIWNIHANAPFSKEFTDAVQSIIEFIEGYGIGIKDDI